jgi:hypothetical protein
MERLEIELRPADQGSEIAVDQEQELLDLDRGMRYAPRREQSREDDIFFRESWLLFPH